MKRRKFILGAGAAAAAGGTLVGSGAFTSVEADRDVTVSVAGDSEALLALRGIGPNSDYVVDDGGTIGFDLTGSNSNVPGDGVNADAVTVLAGFIEVQNQGTQEVAVTATPLSFVETSGGDTLALLLVPETSFPSVTIGVGETETYSAIVDDFSPNGSQLSLSNEVTFTAEATQ